MEMETKESKDSLSDEVDFKPNTLLRDEQGHYIIIYYIVTI